MKISITSFKQITNIYHILRSFTMPMLKLTLFLAVATSIVFANNAQFYDKPIHSWQEAVATCNEFFNGDPWPKLLNTSDAQAVKLCQNQKKSSNVVVFATLFSTKYRIPLYTANIVILHNISGNPRPEDFLWKRVSSSLCNFNIPPTNAIFSELQTVTQSKLKQCGKLQAVDSDYEHNKLHFDRGHLSPNAINNQNKTKQWATFTLTNAAPQYPSFNRFSWKEYECVTQFTILQLVPGERVFVMTGTFGSALDKNNNPIWMNSDQTSDKNQVKVPGFYWKLVCYPGNQSQGKLPWGYALMEKNENIKKKADISAYITIKQFSYQYFKDPPVSPNCINAPLGAFETFLINNADILEKKCTISERMQSLDFKADL